MLKTLKTTTAPTHSGRIPRSFSGEPVMPATPTRGRNRYRVLGLVILALAVLALLIGVIRSSRDRAVRQVPGEARAQLLQQSLQELRSTCLESYASRGPLREHCIGQAKFVLLFPECGTECQKAAGAVLPHAYR
jgi:hypothetical protein